MKAITVDRLGRAWEGIYTYQVQGLGAVVLPGTANGEDCITQATVYGDEPPVIGPEVYDREEQDKGFALVLWQLPQDEGGWVPVYTGTTVLVYSQDCVLARMGWNDYLIVQSIRDNRVQLLLDPALAIWKRIV